MRVCVFVLCCISYFLFWSTAVYLSSDESMILNLISYIFMYQMKKNLFIYLLFTMLIGSYDALLCIFFYPACMTLLQTLFYIDNVQQYPSRSIEWGQVILNTRHPWTS